MAASLYQETRRGGADATSRNTWLPDLDANHGPANQKVLGFTNAAECPKNDIGDYEVAV